jgi:hypothetical protein
MQLVDLPADRLEGEVVAGFYFTDERPVQGPAALLDWRLNDVLTRSLIEGKCQGRAGEHLLVRNNGKLGCEWVLFAGGGNWQGLEIATYQGLLRHLFGVCLQAGFHRVALGLAPLDEMSAADLESLVRGTLDTLVGKPFECLLSLKPV